MRRIGIVLGTVIMALVVGPGASAAGGPDWSPVEQDIIRHLDTLQPDLIALNQDIWAYAEMGLQEYKSAARLVDVLKKAGFRVREGVSNMPTAFVAEYGSGRPIIGITAEYDALPELAQEMSPERKPIPGRQAGHGCGHCALGTAAVGSVLALKSVYDQHGLKGTIRLYGTPAEETVIGKVYMVLDDQFKDLDVCLHWHPMSKNKSSYSSNQAIISAKFTFVGVASHAAFSPEKGRSALKGVELMNIGVNYMREHIKDSSRIHYVITNGGAQPNVVPATAQVWYYVRGATHEDAIYLFDWVCEIAEGAAKMTRTKMEMRVETDCHEIIPNLPLARLIARHFKRVGPPRFTPEDIKLASQLQEAVARQFGSKEKKALEDTIEEIPAEPTSEKGSTDVGDISWQVPTGGLGTACMAAGSPGHSWQVVVTSGSPIAHKGLMVAAKVLALSAAELLQNPKALEEAKADFQKRMKDRPYETRIPKGQKAPKTIR
jgi:aminobenzoyl-glutamate utilization protein B